MEYVMLDLEWNSTYSSRLNGFFNEIIEFGAVKFDDDFVEKSKFSMLVYPEVSGTLNNKTKSLTNIKKDEIKEAQSFNKVFHMFKKFLGNAILLTWGISDMLVLMQNNKYYNGGNYMTFINSYVDVQTYCQERLSGKFKENLGLSTAKDILNIDDDGINYHRALDDSRLAMMCLKKTYDKDAFKGHIKYSGNEEFYKRLSFKNIFISNLKDEKVDKTKLYFICDVCGKRAKRISPWEFKNRSHRAEFRCRNCNNYFSGRVQFKLTYDGVIVKKTIVHLQ